MKPKNITTENIKWAKLTISNLKGVIKDTKEELTEYEKELVRSEHYLKALLAKHERNRSKK